MAVASNDSLSSRTRTFTDPRPRTAPVDRLTFGGGIVVTGTGSYPRRPPRCAAADSRSGTP
ncbi:hypothetical protein ACFVZ3_17430 [Kitasatospora purpeofusca]|uniref:hypothetical protein n=1 Tax=Kitasatospora purpeofusca TaxID=67352 RepID=UPI00367B1F36